LGRLSFELIKISLKHKFFYEKPAKYLVPFSESIDPVWEPGVRMKPEIYFERAASASTPFAVCCGERKRITNIPFLTVEDSLSD